MVKFPCCSSAAGADPNAHAAPRNIHAEKAAKAASRKTVTFNNDGNRAGEPTDFHVTREGTNGEWASGNADAQATGPVHDDSSEGGSVYLDAVESMDDIQYSFVAAYPPLVLDAVPPVSSNITMSDPKTLMRPQAEQDSHDLAVSDRAAKAMEDKAKAMLEANRVGGMRRSTRALRKELTKPGVVVEERGFPGELTEEEVEAVQHFRRELEKRDPVYSEIVHGFSAVEDEPFSLCRYLRARKFNPEETFKLLDGGKDLWREAKKNDFYPDLEQAIGVNQALFTSQYPFVYHGRAKNGCPVAYLQCGGLQSEGVLCITTMDKVPRYFWNSFMFDFIDQLKMCKEANKNFMRCECMQVYDLKGLSRAQVNNDAIEVIKMANQITTCFPETLHCLVIVNAPGFFSFAWKLIKKFIDPRTASKIEVYSSEKVQTKRLLELIPATELSSDYGGSGPTQFELLQTQARRAYEGSRGCLSELMYVKGSETKFEFEIPANEEMNITIHSRSASGATFSLSKETTMLRSMDVKPPEGANNSAKGGHVEPYKVEISKNIRGPGKFHVIGKPIVKSSPGYFLFVGDRFEANNKTQ